MGRAELLSLALELGELPEFQHQPDLRSRRLLSLLDDATLRPMVAELIEAYRAARR